MEKQKVKVGKEHFKINLSNRNVESFFKLKSVHSRATQHHHQANLNFVRNNCLNKK